MRAESTPEGLNYASTKKADLVNAYIENQAEHHQVITFQDELRKFLANAGRWVGGKVGRQLNVLAYFQHATDGTFQTPG